MMAVEFIDLQGSHHRHYPAPSRGRRSRLPRVWQAPVGAVLYGKILDSHVPSPINGDDPLEHVLRKPTATIDHGDALSVEGDAVRRNYPEKFRACPVNLDRIAFIGIIQGRSQGVGWAVLQSLSARR